MPHLEETIFALASASGRAGVSILRISGPQTSFVIEQLTQKTIKPREASLRLLKDPATGEAIDRVLLLWFPAPRSFTGEDILEIHAHGSTAVVQRLLKLLGSFDDVRLAEPGEFARRAFENGKMDLTAIEGLADLINAQTEGQRAQALRQSEGQLGKLYESWRSRLLSASALMEAGIDFSDEQDISDDLANQAAAIVADLLQSISHHLECSGRRGERMRDGFRLVIAGAPNVGKSSLLNVLAQRDVAIVTAQPGTTTDIIEINLTIGDFPVLVSDTAGIRQTDGLVENEGIRRALECTKAADLVLLLEDPENKDGDNCILQSIKAQNRSVPVWRILSKADLPANSVKELATGYDLTISTKTDNGLAGLLARLETHLAADRLCHSEPVITRARHRAEVEAAHSSLSVFLSSSLADNELRAEDLRQATTALGRLTGRIDVEELLGEIFGEFCIGK